MAKLKNIDKIWTAPAGQAVTVGNNRTITRESDGVFTCRLHGAPVATIETPGASGIARVTLDSCGYHTATTRAAMSDFLDAFGITAGVSFAGGVVSARWKMPAGAWRSKAAPAGVLQFTGHRYA